MESEYIQQYQRADQLAKLYVKHVTNEKGELLANVHENEAF